ncbi:MULTISPECIES: fimbrillin family protein [Sphingobacterium]|uniref:fimbrillin family protein n=1 Tax=Sphingobacterium TaxID=28453 RepID=UPI002579C348|nr:MULTISPECIES: fimbrillin family protein [Sphingobacterium]
MKLKNTKTLLSLIIAVTIFIFSCKKENSTTELSTENAIVNVKMNGIAPEVGSKLAKASIGGSSAATAAVQQVTVPFGEDLVVRATLTEVKASQGTALRASAAKAATTLTGAGEIVAFNGDYKIYIYKDGSSTLEKTVDGKSAVVNKFELAPGKYKFVVSAYGNPAGTGADKDPLAVEIFQTVTAGNNNLDVVLKHKLTEITVKFDAGSGRRINAISNGTVKPNYNYTFDETTGLVTFGSELAAKGFTFPTQAEGQVWTSSPVMIAVDNSNGTGEVKLANVTINNKPGNVSLPGLTLKKGVQYVLELNLGAKQVIEIGGSNWAVGNLTYDASTGKYGFAEANKGIGNYFFPNYVIPKVVPGPGTPNAWEYQTPTRARNGAAGDPCALIDGNAWRLPTEVEISTLIQRTNVGGADANPQRTDAVARFVDTYDSSAAGKMGMFFGIYNHPGSNIGQYLFMLFGGEYNYNNSIGGENNKAYYLISATNGGFKKFEMGGTKGSYGSDCTISGITEGTAVQVRCVKK